MQDEYERLRKRIEEGLEAADELQRRLEVAERRERSEKKKQFRLIKGSAIGAAVWAGAEWFFDPRKIAVAFAAAAVTTGAVISEQPGSPGSDPPQAINPPASVKPSVRPSVTPTPPPRTSPPRTQAPMRIAPPAEPPSIRPTVKPKEKPTVTPTVSSTPTQPPPPASSPAVSLPVTPTVMPSVAVVETITPDACTINLLGIKVCLPLG